MGRVGYVYVSDTYAGIIEELEDGYSFSYDQNYLADKNSKPVSLTLPLREEAYISKTMIPFFDGLIPEGWLLELTLSNWHIDRRDRMGLLLTVCLDPIGNVSVRKERL